MRLVVDAIAVRPGSAAIVIGNLLAAWRRVAPEDEITVLADGPPDFPVPDGVAVEVVGERSGSIATRIWAQSVGIRRACGRLEADALLSAVTASAFLGAPCPHGAFLHDLRHELRPAQFSARRRAGRKVLYGWSFRHASAIFCNSERTRRDLVSRHPRLQSKAHVALLGADHAARWQPSGSDRERYVLAFGHFANKNVTQVLHAWRAYAARHDELVLRICGLGGTARTDAERVVAELGIGERVQLLPWVSDQEFESLFAGATVILFPSDFEGFGLPALEALLIGVPVVISDDPALLEVAGGHAVVAEDDRPDTLAAGIEQALKLNSDQIAAGVAHARSFTWERCARKIREVLVERAGAQPHIPDSSR